MLCEKPAASVERICVVELANCNRQTDSHTCSQALAMVPVPALALAQGLLAFGPV